MMTLKKEKENYFFFLNSDPFFTYLRLNSRTSEKDALKQNLTKNDTIVTTNSHSKACRFRKSMQTWTIIKHWLKSSCKTRLYNTEGFVGSRGEDVSLHWFTFNNRWLKLFIYSPLLSSVSLVCNLNWKRGQFGGKGDDARTGFSLDGRIKRKRLWERLLHAAYSEGATTAGSVCLDGDPGMKGCGWEKMVIWEWENLSEGRRWRLWSTQCRVSL